MGLVMGISRKTFIGVILLFLIGAGGMVVYARWFREPARSDLGGRVEQVLRDVQLDPNPVGRVYVALRVAGEKKGDLWFQDPEWKEAVARAIDRLAFRNPGWIEKVETIEICLPYAYEEIPIRKRQWNRWEIHRGVKGIAIEKGKNRSVRLCPTEMVARNLSFEKARRNFLSRFKIKPKALHAPDVRVSLFEAHQLLIPVSTIMTVTPMFRGNTLVPLAAVTREDLEAFARRMAAWMFANVQDDGRMTYQYFPSRGEESTSNNAIRQWMASVCLQRWLAVDSDQDHRWKEKALLNLGYNFKHFYQEDGDVGYIYLDGNAKLGAAALAALAIVESTERSQFHRQEMGLRRFVEGMWQKGGAFRTFYRSDRNDNQNFYPGEALLLWAILYAERPDQALLKKIMASFQYYRQWHRENRNPAFIPWHTQAYVQLWKKTRNTQLRDFVFEMNDWLIREMQQWDDLPYEDLKGRFYSPSDRYGPPHASSDGVYLEGLVDAYWLASQVQDRIRAEHYREAIVRGFRHVMQLEFRDEVDLYYIYHPERVRGGIRTTVYHNAIRVDNVQHNLMAVMKWLAF